MTCPCGSLRPFASCCESVIDKDSASTAEQLMRSRYTAFTLGNMDYIYRTYSAATQAALDPKEFLVADPTRWLGLHIVNAGDQTVEFKAYFTQDTQLCVLHEVSSFTQEQGHWRYAGGNIVQHGAYKHPRNAPCICNSGLKFKRCCMKRFN